MSITFLQLQAGIKFLASNYSLGSVSARSISQVLMESEIHGGGDFVAGTRGTATGSCTTLQSLSVCRNEPKIGR